MLISREILATWRNENFVPGELRKTLYSDTDGILLKHSLFRKSITSIKYLAYLCDLKKCDTEPSDEYCVLCKDEFSSDHQRYDYCEVRNFSPKNNYLPRRDGDAFKVNLSSNISLYYGNKYRFYEVRNFSEKNEHSFGLKDYSVCSKDLHEILTFGEVWINLYYALKELLYNMDVVKIILNFYIRVDADSLPKCMRDIRKQEKFKRQKYLSTNLEKTPVKDLKFIMKINNIPTPSKNMGSGKNGRLLKQDYVNIINRNMEYKKRKWDL